MRAKAQLPGTSDGLDLFEPAPPPAPPLGAEGHRARMRDRLLTGGPDALSDHEMLEMVLFLALPRRDTKALARALIGEFGSFASAIAAPLNALRAVDGMGDAGASALKIVQAAALRLARAQDLEQPRSATRTS
jgi:DNA repair protein RadC